MKNVKHDISNTIIRLDAMEKSDGSSQYVTDISLPDMCYARTLRSTIARGKIVQIRYPDLPNGYTIVDHRDVPGKNVVKMLAEDWPFFAEEKVNFVGEPIALIVGPDREVLDTLLREINIEYEEQEPIFGIDQGINPPVDPIFGEDNLFASYHIRKGEPEILGKGDFRIFTETFETGPQEHVYLEPQGMIGLLNEEKITILGSMQCPYYVKNAVMQGLGWDEKRVRIQQTTTGGGFGGKEEYPSQIAGHAAFAALKTKKPVKLIFDREEDILATTKRHPSRINIKAYVDKKNTVCGLEMEIVLDGGAYAGLSAVVLQRSMFAASGVYQIPHIFISGRVAASNVVPFGAFRGFGAPQAIFAIEMMMQHIAQALNEEPAAFKKKHFIKQGELTVTSGIMHNPVKLDHIDEQLSKQFANRPEKIKDSKRLWGRGVSYFLHGCGFTGSGEQDIIKARVKLQREADHRVKILVANVELGQGAQTTLRKIVAETLGISPGQIDYPNPDTDVVPDSGPTVASRTAMVTGGLLKQAAEKMKDRWSQDGVIVTEARYKQPAHLRWDQDHFIGDAYPDYAWGAVAIDVEVDPVTFEIEVKDINTVFDVGHPLDKMIMEGQIDGGIAQGIGWASIEKMIFSNGHIQQANITDYIIPSAKELPPIHKILIDNPYPGGPYGAKGGGELTLIGAAPAFTAAVENAIGKKINKIPVTPEDLMEVMI